MFLFLQMHVMIRWSAIEQIIMDKKMIYISFSIIHWQSYIWWINKDFVKLPELFLIYKFGEITVGNAIIIKMKRFDEKPRYQRQFYQKWIFRYGISIYLIFFLIFCMLSFIFHNFWMVNPTVPLHFKLK